ncbi:hypothetical protein [Breoghania sp. L-A4]|nr:hypothetical protein [Breoghania sp. L-A4]
MAASSARPPSASNGVSAASAPSAPSSDMAAIGQNTSRVTTGAAT